MLYEETWLEAGLYEIFIEEGFAILFIYCL